MTPKDAKIAIEFALEAAQNDKWDRCLYWLGSAIKDISDFVGEKK